MRDQIIDTVKNEIMRQMGYKRYVTNFNSPNQELPELTDSPREWREIVINALDQYHITPLPQDLDRLINSRATVHDIVDYIQRQIDEKERANEQ